MKIWTLLLMALIVGGCATSNETTLPDWETAAREETEIASPIELPLLCEIPRDGVWTPRCWKLLSEYDIIAFGNTEIAQHNAAALAKTEMAYDKLINAGKLQQEVAVIRQEMYEQEKQDRTYDKWFYRTVIVVGGLAVIGVSQ